jgi:hypothetical protein
MCAPSKEDMLEVATNVTPDTLKTLLALAQQEGAGNPFLLRAPSVNHTILPT